MTTDNQLQLSCRIDQATYELLNKLASDEDRTLSSLLRRIVRKYLEEHERNATNE